MSQIVPGKAYNIGFVMIDVADVSALVKLSYVEMEVHDIPGLD